MLQNLLEFTRAQGEIEDLFPTQLMALTKYYYEQQSAPNNISSIKQGERTVSYNNKFLTTLKSYYLDILGCTNV